MWAEQDVVYRVARRILTVAVHFYFRRVERFHFDRVPATGPVLFTSNHPGSLTDSLLIGTSIRRKVNFVGTVQLFKSAPLRWLLSRCGVIPINRVQDDPKGMRMVAQTFEACYRVLERGEVVGIFPEGITYEDSQLKEIKTGAARMALELEHRHGGDLGLQVVPVGITYSAKERYRSDALVNFGAPLRAASFLDGYDAKRKECIQRLTSQIRQGIEGLILHLPEMEVGRVVEGVKRLYLEQLIVGNQVVREPVSPEAEKLLVSRRVAEIVQHVFKTQPERAARFAAKLYRYERWLERLHLTDEGLGLMPSRSKLIWQSTVWALCAFLAAPIALYGWVHRALPYALIRWSLNRFTQADRRKAQTSITFIVAGLLVFIICYAAYTLVFHAYFGWPASLWYALSLPVASLFAWYYTIELRRMWSAVWNVLVFVRAPMVVRRLERLRQELVGEIESVRAEMRKPEATVAS